MNVGITSYGKLPEISNDQYLKFKQNAIENQPKVGKLDFSKFNFEKGGKISYKKTDGNSQLLNISDSALKRLCEELGLNKKFNPGKPVTKQLILNVLKDAKSTISMNFSMNQDGVITNLTRKDQKMLDYATFFDLFERTKNSTDELSLNQLIFNDNTGELMINSRSNHELGFKDEIFKTGISFGNTNKGFNVQGTVNRLVCSNGMILPEKELQFNTDSLNQITIPRYQEFMKKLKQNHYQPLTFTEKWKTANQIPASIAEVQQTYDLIQNKIPEGDIELYLPNYGSMLETINKKIGFIDTIPNESLMNLKSPFSVANCLNAITDVASHTLGISGNASKALQVASGRMLYKNSFDTQNILPQIF
jgi:hypothetical protein